jgi:hypothetical protein
MLLPLTLALGAPWLAGCKKDAAEAEAPIAPELSMFEPAAAAMVPAGSTVMRGQAAGLTDLQVNGVPVTLDGNLWEGSVDLPRGITTFEVSGRNAQGDRLFLRQSVLAGDFGPPGDPTVSQAVAIRANQGALDAAGDLVVDLLRVDQINELLPGMNPVYEDSYGVFGLDAVTIAADIGSVWFDEPRLTLVPGAGALDVEIVLPGMRVDVPVRGEVVGVDFDTNVLLTADEAVVTGLLEVHAEQGDLAASLISPSLTLEGFSFDVSALPGSIEDALLSDTIRDVITNLINEQMALLVPDLLDDQLAGLDIAFETELFGKVMSLAAQFDTVTMDRDGLFLSADLDIDIPGPFPRQTEGPLLSGAGEPRPSTGPDLAVLLNDDVVNKLLHDLWRTGMLDLELSTADGSLDAFYLAPFGARDEGALAIDAALPPILIERGADTLIQFGEITVRVDTPGGENGTYLVATLAGEVPVDVGLQGGNLRMELGDPELVLMVRDNDWGMENETITAILQAELPIDVLLALVGDLSIPMPTIGDLVLPDANVGRDATETWTTIDMRF